MNLSTKSHVKWLGNQSVMLMVMLAMFVFASCSKKDDNSTTTTATKKYLLVIENGAQSVKAKGSVKYNSYLVNTSGEKVTTGTVTYTLNTSSGTFTGSVLKASDTASSASIVTASVTQDGVSYTASALVNFIPSGEQGTAFTVSPEAVMWTTGAGTIPLWPIYLGPGTSAYTYTSSNPSVIKVSAAGEITFVAAGSANINVGLKVNGADKGTVTVPVLVLDQPTVPLPVTRIQLDKKAFTMFKGDTKQFSVKAYNSNNEDVTSTVTFAWKVLPKDTTEDATLPISVTGNGVTANVTGVNFDDAYLVVTGSGLTDQAEVNVVNDKFIFCDPFFAILSGGGMDSSSSSNPASVTVTATRYQVDKAKFYANNNDPSAYSEAAPTSDYSWTLPLTGSAIWDVFLDIVDITPSGANKKTALIKAKAGKTGSNVVLVSVPNEPDTDPGAVAVTTMP